MSKDKKMIISVIVLFSILCLAGLGLYIFGILESEKWAQIVGMISNFISPTTIFGIVVKQFMNIKHKKEIQKIVSPVEEIKVKKREVVAPKVKETELILDGEYFKVYQNEKGLVFIENAKFSNESEYRACLVSTINKIENIDKKNK